MYQINNTIHDIRGSELSDSESDQELWIIKKTEKFISDSRKERKALRKTPDLLRSSREGKIPAKPLSKKQRNYLQYIPKDTISAYWSICDRIYGHELYKYLLD